MIKIKYENLSSLFQRIQELEDLILPIRNGESVNFELWDSEKEVDLMTLKTVKSPKDAFFPQSENLYSVIKENKKMKVKPQELQNKPFVLFGVKGCDLMGFEVLDKVFLSEPIDRFYEARRACGTIVSLACNEPEESCFCKVFGIDCTEPMADVITWLSQGYLFWESKTFKGETLTEAVCDLFEGCTDDEQTTLNQEKQKVTEIREKLPYMNLSLEGWNEEVLNKRFDSKLWESLSKACLGCGTCTFVCPTCQCYDIKDYTTPNGILRYRCWDSCMYSDFTMMAHGNNRTTQMQRYRQRFMHKLVYFPANNEGMYSCVGCGRCVEKCPSALNIVKVIKSFEKEGGNQS